MTDVENVTALTDDGIAHIEDLGDRFRMTIEHDETTRNYILFKDAGEIVWTSEKGDIMEWEKISTPHIQIFNDGFDEPAFSPGIMVQANSRALRIEEEEMIDELVDRSRVDVSETIQNLMVSNGRSYL